MIAAPALDWVRRSAVVSSMRGNAPLRVLYLSVVIDAIGLATYTSFSAVYFTLALHLSPAKVGVVLTAAAVGSVLGVLPVSRLAESLGSRRALIVLFAWRAVAFALLATAHGLIMAVIAAAAAGLLSRSMSPVTQSLAIDIAGGDQERVEILAVIRTLRNAGFTVGALPAAVAIATHQYRMVLAAAIVLFAVAAVLGLRLPRTGAQPVYPSRRARVIRDGRFLLLVILAGVLAMQTWLLAVGVPLWLVTRTGAPRWLSPVLVVLNTVLVLALQVRASRGSQHPGRSRRLLVVAAAASAAACVLPVAAAGIPAVPAAFILVGDAVLFTVGELWLTAGGWALTLAFSPPELRMRYLAVFNFGQACVTIAAPSIVGWLIAAGRPGWLAAATLFAVVVPLAAFLPITPVSAVRESPVPGGPA